MAGTKPQDLTAYAGKKFQTLANNLIKDARDEAKLAAKNASQISSVPFKVTGSGLSDLNRQKSRVLNHANLFEKAVKQAKAGKAKSAKYIDAVYEDLAFELAALRVLNEKWEAIFGTKLILQVGAMLSLVPGFAKVWKDAEGLAEKRLGTLEKALKDARNERWAVYAGQALDFGWTVFKATSPHMKALKGLRAVGADYAFSLATDALLDTPDAVAGQTVSAGIASGKAGAEAKKLDGLADKLGKVGNILDKKSKLDDIKTITGAYDKIHALKLAVRDAKNALIHLRKTVVEGEAAVLKAYGNLQHLAKNAKTAMNKAKNADQDYKAMLKRRDQSL